MTLFFDPTLNTAAWLFSFGWFISENLHRKKENLKISTCSRFHLPNNVPSGGTRQGRVLSPPAVQNLSNNKQGTTQRNSKKKRKKRQENMAKTRSVAWLLATNPALTSTDTVAFFNIVDRCGDHWLWTRTALCCSASSPQDPTDLPAFTRALWKTQQESPKRQRSSPCKMLFAQTPLCDGGHPSGSNFSSLVATISFVSHACVTPLPFH